MESNFQSKFLQKTSRINKWLKGQAYDCLRETEKERHIPSQLAGRAYSACTASLPNLTLFVIPSSPIYIIFNSDCKNWSCTSCSKKILPEDVSNCRISKGIAAVDKKKKLKKRVILHDNLSCFFTGTFCCYNIFMITCVELCSHWIKHSVRKFIQTLSRFDLTEILVAKAHSVLHSTHRT